MLEKKLWDEEQQAAENDQHLERTYIAEIREHFHKEEEDQILKIQKITRAARGDIEKEIEKKKCGKDHKSTLERPPLKGPSTYCPTAENLAQQQSLSLSKFEHLSHRQHKCALAALSNKEELD